jgi:hypothetical protein
MMDSAKMLRAEFPVHKNKILMTFVSISSSLLNLDASVPYVVLVWISAAMRLIISSFQYLFKSYDIIFIVSICRD